MRHGWKIPRALVPCLVLSSVLLAPAAARAVTITRASSDTFYLDAGDSLYAGYAAYRVVNDSGPDIADLWVRASSFAGPNLSLAPNEDGLVRLGGLATGDTAYAYVYLQATAATAVPENHTVSAYEGAPPGGSLLGSAVFPLTAMGTIAANANKVTTVVNGPDPPGLGGIMTLTVTGETGTIGGTGIFAVTPIGFLEWPADAVQLTDVGVVFSGSPNAGARADSLLYFLTASSANTAYTVTYTFRIAGVTTQPAQFFPVQYISSGSQIKHTSNVNRTTFGPVSPSDNYLTLEKTVAPSILAAADTVTYAVTLRNASGTIDATVDEIRDDLPATPLPATYVPGSAVYGGVGIGDPGTSGSGLTFLGPFAVPAADSAVLTYDVVIPDSAGVYTNRATALVGLEQIDRTLDTTDDVPATAPVTLSRVRIGLAKAVLVPPVNHGDGTYSLGYRFVIENAGNADLRQVQVSDDLAAAFTGASGFTVDSVAVPLGPLTPAPEYTGSAPDTLLLAGTDTLAVGAAAEVRVFLTVTPGSDLGPYDNTARATAIGLGAAAASDVSTDGTIPDADGNGDPTDDSAPTPVSFTEAPELGAAKRVLSGPINNGDGTYSFTYAFAIQNSGDVELRNLQLADDLGTTFAGATSFTVDAVTVTGGSLTLQAGYTGTVPDTLLLAGTDTLPAGASATLELALTVAPGAGLGPYANTATAQGTSPAGGSYRDASADGAVPDADGNGDPTDDGAPTPVSFTEAPELGLAKAVFAGPTNNGDGSYALTYRFTVVNSGDVALSGLRITDDLATALAGATSFAVDAVTVTGGPLTADPGFTGSGAGQDLLAGSDVLQPGQSGTVDVAITVTPGSNLGPYANTASTQGTSPAAATAGDVSADGTVPDADGNGDPTDDSGATFVSFTEAPELGAAKRVLSGPVNNGNGTYSLTYALVVQNSGDVELRNLQLIDDLAAAFAGASGFTVDAVTVTGGGLTADPAYTGTAPDTLLLAGTDTLPAGGSATLEVALTVTPGTDFGPYGNTATAAGTSPAGTGLADASANGAVPDADGNGDPTDDNAPTPVNFTESPEVGLAKAVVAGPVNNGDGTYSLTYGFVVGNSGDVSLSGLQITDDLATAFAGASGFTVDSVTVTAGPLTAGPGFTGNGGGQSLLGGSDTLQPGQTGTLELAVTVTPGSNLGPYANTAFVQGTSPGGTTASDVSADGAVPDADGNGDPTDDGTPTPVSFTEAPEIGVAKRVSAGPSSNGDGTFTLTYTLQVENSGDGPLSAVQLNDDLGAAFAGATGFTVNGVTVTGGPLTANPGYTGVAPNTALLAGTDALAPGGAGSVAVTVTVTPGLDLGPYDNSALGRGRSPSAAVVQDTSTDGTVPDADGNGDPTDDGVPTPVTFVEAPELGAAKRVVSGPAGNGDGTYTLTYAVRVENSGDAAIGGLNVADDLAATFAGATAFAVDSVTVVSGAATLDPGFTGTAPGVDLLTGSDTLLPGGQVELAITVTVTPGSDLGPYLNTAVARGTSAGGSPLSDLSADGSTPDADGNGDPADDGAPTPVSFTEAPGIGLAKRVSAGPAGNGDGTYTLGYTLELVNAGDVPLAAVQITDDLGAAFAGAAAFTVDGVAVAGGPVTANPGYTGSGPGAGLLSGADVLPAGSGATVTVTVTVTPGGNLGPYGNGATASGTSPAGAGVADQSVDGPVPDADGNGDPTDDTGATFVSFTESPQIGLAKETTAGPSTNGDGTQDVTYRFRIENSGDVPLAGVQLTDDLAAAFAGAAGFAVQAVTPGAGGLTPDPAYTGSAPNTNLLSGADVLAPGASATLDLTVRVTPGAVLGPYGNSASASGTSPAGAGIADLSVNGAVPDADGNGDPTDDTGATPVTFTERPVLGAAKAVSAGPVDNGDGTHSVAYAVNVRNLGDVPLSGVQLTDDLGATFAGATGFAVESVLVTEGSLTVNPGYTGTVPDTALLAGTDVLAPGARATLEIVVTVNPGADPGPYGNTAFAAGSSPAGIVVRDASANGTDPDPDGDGDPTDNDVATPVLFTLAPSAVLVEKHALRSDAVTGDIVGYEVTVTNAGPLPLAGVRVEDTIPAGFKFAAGSASLRRAGPDGDLGTGDDVETAVIPQGGRPLVFDGLSLAGQESVRLRYALIVGSGVTGGEYVNEAAPYLDGSRIGNIARAPVRVGADPIFDRTTVLGKVFHDRNGDGWQSPTDATHVTVTGGFPEGVYQVNSTSLDRGDGPRLLRDRGFTSPVEVGLDLGTLSARRSPLDPPGHMATLEVALTDPVLKPLWVTTAEGTRLRMDPDGTVTEHHVGAKAAGRTGQDIQVSRRMESDGDRTRIVYTITNEAFTEHGIPGVRLVTAEGWVTETDAQGRFHLADVDGGSWDRGRNLILKVDPGSLPPGSSFTTENPRVIRVTPSLAVKVNFGVRLPAQIPPQRDGHPDRDSRGSDYAGPGGGTESGSGGAAMDVPADMGAPFPPDTAPPGLEPASPGLDPSRGAVPGTWPDRAAGDERTPASPFQLPGSGSVWITTLAAGTPRLDAGAPEVALLDPEAVGNPVRFTLACNYTDFLQRWELRIYRDDDDLLARPVRTLRGETLNPVQTVDWDGSLDTGSLVRPGDGFLYVLRVYDAQGRFDETAPRAIRFAEKTGETPRQATLHTLHGPVQGGEILGNGNLARRAIPLHASRVRIHGEGVGPRVRIAVDGAPVPVDAQGRFAVERLVPGGTHEFRVEAIGPDGDVWSRLLSAEVPESRFFMVGIADLTLGHNQVSGNVEPLAPDDHMDGDVYADGRVALYMKGKIRGKYLVAAHLDTHEDHLSDLAGNLHKKDARSVLRRLDPDRYYPVYGDGSTTVDDAQSQGRLYARVEWDGSSVLWGNYETGLTGTEFAQYDRSLYGAKVHHRMGALNDYGEPAAEITAFASEAQTALGHDELAGTGGSLYYLSRHDIVQGSEKLHVEVRDRDSDRVLENVALVRYRDYEIDEIQGRVILTRPLETVVDPTAPSVVRDAPLDGNRVLLLADYEYVPDGFVAGRMSAGTRAVATAGDHGSLGGTFAHENRSGTDYQLWGVDGSVRAGKGTYLKAEVATSEARQAATGRVSTDGGLTFTDLPGTGGARRGQAVGVESRLDVSELTGGTADAEVAGWWKRREAGFSTARLENANERTDYGGEFTWRAGEVLSVAGRAAVQDEENVREDRRYGLEADFRTGDRVGLSAETRRVEERPAAGEDGTGTLAGLRLDVSVTPDVTVYGIGQGTLARSGTYTENNLATAGIGAQVNDGLTLRAEGSSGNRGDALRVGANFALSQWFRLDLDNTSGSLDPRTRIGANARLSDGYEVYGTYTLSPDRTDGRRGVMTLGQRKALSNQLRMFTESQVSRSRTGTGLSHVFGLELEPNRLWTLGASVQSSNAEDAVPGGVRRHVISLSAGYDGGETRTASKLEYRKDEGGRRRTQWLTTNRLDVRTGPSLTVTGKFSLSVTEDAVDAAGNARFVESSAGFAYRPVDADRWQLLGKYTFLVDMPSPGQVPERPDERLHVVSTEGLVDLTRTFGVGVKTAARFGQVRLDRTGDDWLQSRFYLGVVRGVAHVMQRWDGQVEYRWLRSADGEDRRQGVLVAAFRNLNRNLKAGAGFNFTSFSDDLTELGYDNRGVFVNVVGSY